MFWLSDFDFGRGRAAHKMTFKRLRVVCFSKDRPFQLREYLRTLHEFITINGRSALESMDIYVIFVSENREWLRMYQMVEKEFSNVTFVYETSFADDLKKVIFIPADANTPEFIMFGVDDTVFFNRYDLSNALHFLQSPGIDSFSFQLKLHPSICYSHTTSSSMMPLPTFASLSTSFLEYNDILMYDPATGMVDWDYPWELCSSIYRIGTVREVVHRIIREFGEAGISHPNLLEARGNDVVKKIQPTGIRCAIPGIHVSTVLTINRVQSVFENPVYDHPNGDLVKLNRHMAKDFYLDTELYQTLRTSSVHSGVMKLIRRGGKPVEENPLVSIIMPVFNAEHYVEEAIGSILNQSYNNFEFIVVLDGCTDGSASIVDKYAAIDSRMSIIRQPKKLGVAKSLNNGIRKASGKYVARMDSDDISLHCRIKCQVDYMEVNSSVNVLGSAVHVIEPDGCLGNVIVYPTTVAFSHWKLMFGCYFAHPTALIRKSVLVSNNLEYDEDLECAEDYDLWLRILNLYPNSIESLGSVLLLYRKHAASMCSRREDEQRLETQTIRQRVVPNILKKPSSCPGLNSTPNFMEAYRFIEDLKRHCIDSISDIKNYDTDAVTIDIELIRKDANARCGEVAFRAMQLDPYSGSQLWGKWAALNPKLSRNIFKKLVST